MYYAKIQAKIFIYTTHWYTLKGKRLSINNHKVILGILKLKIKYKNYQSQYLIS
jgi:hypothetical protein